MPSVPDPVSQASNWTEEQINNPYVGTRARVFYSYNSGTVQMPVCGPDGTSCEVVKVCAAYGQKVVAYVDSRVGTQPKIPPREADVSGVQVFKEEEFVLETPTSDTVGNPYLFTLRGWRKYILLAPLSPDEGDTLLGYWPPTMKGSPTQNTLGPGDLDPSQIPDLPANGDIQAGGDGLFNIQGGSGGQLGIQGVPPPG